MCSVVFVFLELALSALHTLALDTLCIIQQEDSNIYTCIAHHFTSNTKLFNQAEDNAQSGGKTCIYRKMRYGKSVF